MIRSFGGLYIVCPFPILIIRNKTSIPDKFKSSSFYCMLVMYCVLKVYIMK